MLHFLFRHRCDVPYSECKATDHKAECVCKKDFKGNGTEECIPAGFTQEENGRLTSTYEIKKQDYFFTVTYGFLTKMKV